MITSIDAARRIRFGSPYAADLTPEGIAAEHPWAADPTALDPAEFAAMVHASIEARARSRGLRPGRLTRTSVGRLIAGLSPELRQWASPAQDLAHSTPSRIRARQEKVAREFRAMVLRRIGAEAGPWRQHRLYLNETGRPASLVGFGFAATDALTRELKVVAYVWGLVPLVVPQPWGGGFAVGFELCRFGSSILADASDPISAQLGGREGAA